MLYLHIVYTYTRIASPTQNERNLPSSIDTPESNIFLPHNFCTIFRYTNLRFICQSIYASMIHFKEIVDSRLCSHHIMKIQVNRNGAVTNVEWKFYNYFILNSAEVNVGRGAKSLRMLLISRIHEVKANLWHSMQVNIVFLVTGPLRCWVVIRLFAVYRFIQSKS